MDKSRRRITLAGGAFALSPISRAFAAPVGGTAELGLAEIPDGALAEQSLFALPGKLPLIRKTFRPPNFETPVQYFRTPITQNRAFFVRYHLAAIPEVAAKDWTLTVGGESAERELKLSLQQLKREFKPAQVTAVCQCSGNRARPVRAARAGRRVGRRRDGQRAVAGRAPEGRPREGGVKADALEVVFDGADHAPLEKTPDFVKSLPLEMAMDENTLIAFEMNGEPLPHWNGFPARLVVPGWTGTYWVKQLVSVKVVAKPEGNFWMSAAYRLPKGRFKTPSFKSQVAAANEPITTMVVNSLITSLKTGQQLRVGQPLLVKGVAWDGGSGIAQVEVSTDGATWHAAKLGKDLGRFSFREFSFSMPTREPGSHVVMARATSRAGETQVNQLIHNPAGYHHNVIQRIYVEVV
jgi:DMSO/TMAO reductase YedYZ molybdopterin-dependent catalytic subunit